MFFSSKAKKIQENVQRLINLEQKIISLNNESKRIYEEGKIENSIIYQENKVLLDIIYSREKALEKIISEKSKGFPWLSEAISEFYKYQDFEIAKYLEEKKHPAYKQAEKVKEIANENKVLRKQLKIAQNFVNYYENLFPWISEYVGEDLDELLIKITESEKEDDEDADPVLQFVPKGEYERLSSSERNQKALDRYINSNKKSYQIGRDYERYIGFLYEKDGYIVQYDGIEKGYEDLGRDLVCIKNDKIEIVQCKYWASHKEIRENHINQLYGTTVKYYIEHKQIIQNKIGLTLFPELMNSAQITATIVTSTKLSDTAKKFSSALGIKVIEQKPLDRNYPRIKCNINVKLEKIYHLPFDQQYDKTLIKNKGEFYALTVKEAEDKGFRRAIKWKGSV